MARQALLDGGADDWRESRFPTQETDAGAPAAAPEAATAPAAGTPPETAGGSEAPPPRAGDESPNRNFPVPPVPPPPAPGPVFALAGEGGGGAASFARPGTEAAKPFRSQLFATNRSTAASGGPAPARFGAGSAVAGGGVGTPFMPAGLDAGGEEGGAPTDELQRILALIRGGGAR